MALQAIDGVLQEVLQELREQVGSLERQLARTEGERDEARALVDRLLAGKRASPTPKAPRLVDAVNICNRCGNRFPARYRQQPFCPSCVRENRSEAGKRRWEQHRIREMEAS